MTGQPGQPGQPARGKTVPGTNSGSFRSHTHGAPGTAAHLTPMQEAIADEVERRQATRRNQAAHAGGASAFDVPEPEDAWKDTPTSLVEGRLLRRELDAAYDDGDFEQKKYLAERTEEIRREPAKALRNGLLEAACIPFSGPAGVLDTVEACREWWKAMENRHKSTTAQIAHYAAILQNLSAREATPERMRNIAAAIAADDAPATTSRIPTHPGGEPVPPRDRDLLGDRHEPYGTD